MPTHTDTSTGPSLGWMKRAPRRMSGVPALAVAAVLALGATACGDSGTSAPKLPLTAVQVAPLAADNVHSLATAWRDGGAWLEDAAFVQEMLGDLADTFDDTGSTSTEPGTDPVEDTPSLADELDQLADSLEHELFLTDNVVSDDGTTVIYAVPLAMLCPDDEDRPACQATWTDEPVQLRVVSYAEGALTVSVLVGTPAAELASVTLAAGHLDGTVSLSAFAAFARRTGLLDDAEDFQLDTLTGRVSASIEAAGDHRLAVTYGSDPVTLRATADGDTSIALQVGRTSSAVLIDGAARTVDLDNNVGAVTADVTLSDPDGQYPDVRQNLDLPGVTAAMHLDEDAQTLAVTGLSLGSRATTMKVNGQTAVALNLNPSAGRRVDLEIHRVDEGTLEASVSPSLEIVTALALGSIAGPDAGWAANETMTIRFDGAPKPTVRTTEDGSVAVVAGTMSFTSSARPDLSFSATAGQCIAELDLETDFEDEEPHPFESLSVTSCQ